MNGRTGILAGGNWLVDKVKIIDRYPQQDALANILSESRSNGGSSFNVLVDLARLGASFPLSGIGLTGDDAEGLWIREQCARYGIDISQLGVCGDARTSYSDVMTVRNTGRRTFFHQRGANAFLEPKHFDFARSDARIFHLGYLLLLDRLDEPDAEFGTAAARVLSRASEAGLKTSVDVVSEDSNRFSGIVLPALRHVNYCILNEFEIGRTTGIATRPNDRIDIEAVEAASRRLFEEGVKDWVVVHFPEGATALGRDGLFCVQGSAEMPQERIVGAVGAGDAFAAGLLWGLHQNVDMETALRIGVVSAASCLQGAGTSDGILSLNDCLELGRMFGFRKLS